MNRRYSDAARAAGRGRERLRDDQRWQYGLPGCRSELSDA